MSARWLSAYASRQVLGGSRGHWFFRVMPHLAYDAALYHGVSNHLWRCLTDRLLENYVDHLSSNHLEVGVGTAYFLKRTVCADHMRRLTLLDLSPRCLMRSARRLRPMRPEIVQHDLTTPLPTGVNGYQSIGMNYVFHCVPGGLERQFAIIRDVHAALSPRGVFFGATLMPIKSECAIVSRTFMSVLQESKIFHNQRHSELALTSMLEDVFSKVRVERVGCAAVFSAWK